MSPSCCIVELDLSHNRLNSITSLPLLKAVAANGSIQKLNLSHNNLGDSAVCQLALSLKDNTVLERLELAHTSINAKAAVTISYWVKQVTSSITYLNLSANSLGSIGGRALVHAMRTVCQRMHINHVSDNTHSTDSFDEFQLENAMMLSDNLYDNNPIETTSDVNRLLVIDFDVHSNPLREMGVFDEVDPTGSYELDLKDPYDFTVGRILFELADRMPNVVFKELRHFDVSKTRVISSLIRLFY